jgi:hypothetical protein
LKVALVTLPLTEGSTDMNALLIRVFVAAAAAVSLAVPATATAAPGRECPSGWACFWLGPDGTNRAMVVRDENWVNLTGLGDDVVEITNNQDLGDDACIADGPNGTGQTICVDPWYVVRLPDDFVARSVRG